MKKLNTIMAAVALALPIAVTPLAPTTALVASAATTKPAKATTYTLCKTAKVNKVAYRAKTDTTLAKVSLEKSKAKVTPTKRKLATDKTYRAVKAITITTGKKGAKKIQCLELKNQKGTTVGWVTASALTKGAYQKCTLTVTRKTKAVKQNYRAKAASATFSASFKKDGKVTLTSKPTNLTTKKCYAAKEAFYAKTSKKATAHEYVYLKGQGWIATTQLKAVK
ncbi:hypothetical protein D1831_04895 [Lactiplantibacillus garii]|uniref:Uncharacterized protein n=1 Tax=Lactiplantibacillus garii TaxID=2306423 RepID=A0A3R8J8A3_9LACO|nr:hypothetical protein [Lactiplantibacillus garii]RRK10897.1 hypothetical protein D1831_04895 [Lactiplantibacillus garii]